MNILFLNQSETVTATVKKLSVHLIEITGTEPNTSGFHLLNNAGNVFGKYDGFTTLYRELEDGFILSDDGSVYVEPIEPEPEPEPEISLDEVKEAKVSEMNDIQQKLIAQGVDVTLSDGSKEHFSLTERDQTSLVGLQAQVAIGAENIPWHTSDEDEHCKFYSNADMAKITSSALSYVTWHVTYFRDLRIFIRSLESKEKVETYTAVKKFQHDVNIKEDGLAGEVTRAKLNNAYNTRSAAKANNSWVARLQAACNAQGFSNQRVDGIAGPNTLAGCPTLGTASKGSITKLAQERLNALGYNCGSADGKNGPKTQKGIKAFQKAKGLPANGIVDKKTWKALLGL